MANCAKIYSASGARRQQWHREKLVSDGHKQSGIIASIDAEIAEHPAGIVKRGTTPRNAPLRAHGRMSELQRNIQALRPSRS